MCVLVTWHRLHLQTPRDVFIYALSEETRQNELCVCLYFLWCRSERCETDRGFALGRFQFSEMHCSWWRTWQLRLWGGGVTLRYLWLGRGWLAAHVDTDQHIALRFDEVTLRRVSAVLEEVHPPRCWTLPRSVICSWLWSVVWIAGSEFNVLNAINTRRYSSWDWQVFNCVQFPLQGLFVELGECQV